MHLDWPLTWSTKWIQTIRRSCMILINIAYSIQIVLWGWKLALNLCDKLIPHGLSGIAQCCTPNSLQIPLPSHVICHLGSHLEFLKAFKELNLLYNKYVIQIPWGVKMHLGDKLLQSEQCSTQNGLFLPDVMTKVVHIINKIHHLTKFYSIYHHNNNINGFLMYVLVGI